MRQNGANYICSIIFAWHCMTFHSSYLLSKNKDASLEGVNRLLYDIAIWVNLIKLLYVRKTFWILEKSGPVIKSDIYPDKEQYIFNYIVVKLITIIAKLFKSLPILVVYILSLPSVVQVISWNTFAENWAFE